ncbi:unnamed protein product [Protopolystoma xenopodis]|uniref:Uncharacterized protein n=1 Tax=Protopolystoma xenopodis TaxID=117903 RepID=A0A3S5CK34_9PLAT|nr:unnamed protein product [Protopolystoma xenopodis]
MQATCSLELVLRVALDDNSSRLFAPHPLRPVASLVSARPVAAVVCHGTAAGGRQRGLLGPGRLTRAGGWLFRPLWRVDKGPRLSGARGVGRHRRLGDAQSLAHRRGGTTESATIQRHERS